MSGTKARVVFNIHVGFDKEEPWILKSTMKIENKSESGRKPDPVDLLRGILRETIENVYREVYGGMDDDFVKTLITLVVHEIKEARYRIWEEQDAVKN